MKRVTTHRGLNRTEVKYVSDNEAGIYFDTDVYIGAEYICTIEGNKLSEFHEHLTGLVEKYKI